MLFFLFAFFTEVAGTMAGFGSSTLVLPLALLFFDFKSALVIVALLHIFGNRGRGAFCRCVAYKAGVSISPDKNERACRGRSFGIYRRSYRHRRGVTRQFSYRVQS